MIVLAILCIALMAGFIDCKPASEPACSRFDYDEKLLAKTIRLEVAVDGLMERVSKVEQTQQACKALVGRVDVIDSALDALELKIQKIPQGKTGPRKKPCPDHFKYRQDLNLCWKLQKGVKLNKFEAEERCDEDGAHLMILNTSTVVKFIQEWLKTVGAGDTFVGADDIEDEGSFKWRNGEPIQSIPWPSHEPNGGTNSNCLVMDDNYDYKFCDRECSGKHEFLCQIIV